MLFSFCHFVCLLLLSPHIAALFTTPLTQTTGRKCFGSLFTNKVSNLSNLLFAVIQKFKREREIERERV